MHWLDSPRMQLFRFKTSRRSKRSARGKRRPHALTMSQAMRHEHLEDRLALSASMVADLNSYTNDSTPSNITDVGGKAFFTATTNSGNIELFKSDGTAAGTTQLTFGNRLTSYQDLVSFNSKLFFVASDATLGGSRLWSSDGTVAGTAPFIAGGDGIDASQTATSFAVVGSKLYFRAYDASNNLYDLWVSNGTSSGTQPVDPGDPNAPNGGNLGDFTNVNGKLYFTDYDSGSGNYTLWTSSGTAATTSTVAELTGNQPSNLTAVGSELYFEMYDSAASQYALWKSNGTGAGTSMVADIGSTGNPFYDLTSFNSKVYCVVYDTTDAPNIGWALWSSDGMTAGVFKYNSGTTAVQLDYSTPMIVFSSHLYFNGWDATNSKSLWKSDGVSAHNATGTVQTTGASPFNYNAFQFTIVNATQLYFVAIDSSAGGIYDLWKTDGTSAGTAPVQTSGFARGASGYNYYPAGSGSKLFFQAHDVDANGNSPHGVELWTSDGTNAGTAMVTDINTTTSASSPTNLVAVGSEMFFNASTYAPVNGTFLWQSDGTAANTAPVQTSGHVVPTSEQSFVSVGSKLFFTAYGTAGYDLWTSGTGLDSAVDILAGQTNPFNGNFDSSNADAFVNFGGTLYFGAYDAANSKYALWKSDGTFAGTTVLADLDTYLFHLTVVGSNLFWQQYDSANSKYALWEYNGSTASLVSDISTGFLNSLTAVGSSVFFTAYDGSTGNYALWTSNGTTTTNLLETGNNFYDLIAFNSKLFFVTYDSTNSSYTMWSSDGTVGGTAQFLSSASQPILVPYNNYFTVVGSELYGVGYDWASPQQLIKTDGTAAGTSFVQDGSTTIAQYLAYLANDNGTLVFEAYDSAHGYELWQSDGTNAGTLLSADIDPGTNSSSPSYMSVAGSQVFFGATDATHGYEPWVATISPTVVTAGISGPSDGVSEQHRAFVLTGNDSNSGNNSAGFSFAVDFGDGNTETISGQSGLTADHQYATAGNFTITVTATNLADNVSSAALTQVENIKTTELQGGNLAVGGVAGNNAFVITKGTGSSFNVTDNATSLLKNFTPATGEEILLYPGNGTTTASVNDSGTTKDSFTLGNGYVIFNKGTFVATTPTTWTVNGNNSTSGDTFTIVGAATASIVGGTGPNTFNFSTGGSLSGTLAGGTDASKNLLSYAKYAATSGVVVDLVLESATAIDGGAAGGISGIENVTGSMNGGDILVGDANANKLTTSAGQNILIGGSGGGDTLTSGVKGIDILIAGTTSYDSNIAALQTILATWKTSTAANYSSVISTIMSNAFAEPLNTTTVTDSGASDAADTLAGSGVATTDWFFLHNTGGSKPNDTATGVGTGDTETSI